MTVSSIESESHNAPSENDHEIYKIRQTKLKKESFHKNMNSARGLLPRNSLYQDNEDINFDRQKVNDDGSNLTDIDIIIRYERKKLELLKQPCNMSLIDHLNALRKRVAFMQLYKQFDTIELQKMQI